MCLGLVKSWQQAVSVHCDKFRQTIAPELKLIQLERQKLFVDVVIGANDAPLEQHPKLSILLVWTFPRAYSFLECFTVSCGKPTAGG
jgi:hypothetical protein